MKKTKRIRVVAASIPLNPRPKLKKPPFDGKPAKPKMKWIKVSDTFKGGRRS